MTAKILATLTALIGASGTLFAAATAFGLDFNADQRTALEGAAALVLLVAGLWFHPSVPIGDTSSSPDA